MDFRPSTLQPRHRPRSLATAARNGTHTPQVVHEGTGASRSSSAVQAPAAWQAAPGSRVKVRSAISLIMISAKLHPPAQISPNRSVSVGGLIGRGREGREGREGLGGRVRPQQGS